MSITPAARHFTQWDGDLGICPKLPSRDFASAMSSTNFAEGFMTQSTVGEHTRDHVRHYLRVSGDDIAWDFLRAAYGSTANLAVFPLQDLLNLGSPARFNTPGQSQGNWSWRYRAEQLRALSEKSVGYLRELAALYGRDGSDQTPLKNEAAAGTTSSAASSST